MAAATPTTHDAIIKHLYPWEEMVKAMYDNNPFYGLVKKNYKGYGKNWHLPIRIAHTAGRSRVLLNAKTNKTASSVVEFQITLAKDYSLYSVDGQLARQTANDRGAFVQAFEMELEAAMDAIKRSFAVSLYRNHGGAIGRIAASGGISSATITLSDPNDVVNFEKNQVLNLSTADGTSGAIKAQNQPMIVSSVDRDAGTVTMTVAVATAIPTAANSDYIFMDGDFGVSLRGLASWLPATAPAVGGGDSFFGLDRSVDPVRLAGARVDGSGLNPEEALQKACQVAVRNGARLSHFFMNDLNFLDLTLSLGTRRIDTSAKTDIGVGYEGVKVATGMGAVEVYADPNCPYNIAYGLTLSDWELAGPGEFPFVEARDGTKLLREDTADSFEGQIKAYCQLVCRKPHRQVRLALA